MASTAQETETLTFLNQIVSRELSLLTTQFSFIDLKLFMIYSISGNRIHNNNLRLLPFHKSV